MARALKFEYYRGKIQNECQKIIRMLISFRFRGITDKIKFACHDNSFNVSTDIILIWIWSIKMNTIKKKGNLKYKNADFSRVLFMSQKLRAKNTHIKTSSSGYIHVFVCDTDACENLGSRNKKMFVLIFCKEIFGRSWVKKIHYWTPPLHSQTLEMSSNSWNF